MQILSYKDHSLKCVILSLKLPIGLKYITLRPYFLMTMSGIKTVSTHAQLDIKSTGQLGIGPNFSDFA